MKILTITLIFQNKNYFHYQESYKIVGKEMDYWRPADFSSSPFLPISYVAVWLRASHRDTHDFHPPPQNTSDSIISKTVV